MDWEFETFDEPAAPVAEREHCPEGEHDFEIKKVVVEDHRWRIDLAHPEKRFGLVFADLPRGKSWATRVIGTLAAALGYDADGWREATADDLVGRRVRARIYHKVGNAGRLFVNVGQFMPAADEAKPAKTKSKRRPAVEADAGDDIPF